MHVVINYIRLLKSNYTRRVLITNAVVDVRSVEKSQLACCMSHKRDAVFPANAQKLIAIILSIQDELIFNFSIGVGIDGIFLKKLPDAVSIMY